MSGTGTDGRAMLPPASRQWTRVAAAGLGTRRSGHVVERNALVGARGWTWLLSGFFEPVFYLLSVGVGIGALIGDVVVGGVAVPYREFVAPGMLAASAMNGAVLDTTYNVFEKLKYAKTYDAMLATPITVGDIALGELTWAAIRGGVYAAAFLAVMLVLGLVASPWALVALPGALLIAAAFAGAGLLLTSFMRSWQDFMWISLVTLPLFLFSTTFYPLDTYGRGLQLVVQATPLYHGVALERALVLGDIGPGLLLHVGYLAVLGLVCFVAATRRLHRLLVT